MDDTSLTVGKPESGPTRYPYRTLDADKREIRVLDLQPGQFQDPIRCSLRHLFLEDELDYETISYVWGDATQKAYITMDNIEVPFPASSAAALRRMRLENDVRTLWIDAVCIDQNSIDERNHQVAMMRHVYNQGRCNLIYLGEVDDYTAEAVAQAMYEVNEDMRNGTRDFQDALRLLELSSGILKRSSTPMQMNIDLEAVTTFFHNPWFTRLWVMQEAVLSRKSYFYFGKVILALLDVLRCSRWLMFHQDSLPFLLQGTIGLGTSHKLWGFLDEDILGRFTGASVAAALIAFTPQDVSEEADRVFGVLGLMRCTRSQVPPALAPDYTKPLVKIFQDATKLALLESEGPYAMFSLVHHHAVVDLESNNWPSWVPKFHKQGTPGSRPVLLCNSYQADDRTPPRLMPDGNELRSGGVEVCRISKTCSCFPNDSRFDSSITLQWLREAMAFAIGEKQRYSLSPTHDTTEEMKTFACTVTAGYSFAGPNKQDTAAEDYDAFIDYLSSRDAWPPEMREIPPSSPPEVKKASRFSVQMITAMSYRRMFKTLDNRLGIGPALTQEGDVIATIYGCESPCILRPYGEKFKIVGECYVHGIMQGEAVREHKAAGKPDKEFVIC